jgi:hypothetical protein
MRQQINLFQPVLRPQRKPLSLLMMLQLMLVASVAMLAWYGMLYRQTQQIAAELVEVQALRQQTTQRLAQAAKEFPVRQQNLLLLKSVAELREKVAARRDLLIIIRQRASHNTRGFSGQLAAIARQYNRQLWLTRLRLEAGGLAIEMQGETVAAEEVPRFLMRLSQEPVFQGVGFDHFQLRRDSASDQINFTLRTRQMAATAGERSIFTSAVERMGQLPANLLGLDLEGLNLDTLLGGGKP